MKKKGWLSGIIAGMKEPASQISIDYPQPGENVSVGHYAVRISGCKGECEVAIEDGEWQPCRPDGGHCWLDWSPTKPGTYRILARVRDGNKWVKIQRTCRVV